MYVDIEDQEFVNLHLIVHNLSLHSLYHVFPAEIPCLLRVDFSQVSPAPTSCYRASLVPFLWDLQMWGCCSGGSRGGKGGASVPPFGLHLDDKLNGTPLSGYRSKKTAAMAHLRIL